MNVEEKDSVNKLIKCAELFIANNRSVKFNLYTQDEIIRYIDMVRKDIISYGDFNKKVLLLKYQKNILEKENKFIFSEYEKICKNVSEFIEKFIKNDEMMIKIRNNILLNAYEIMLLKNI